MYLSTYFECLDSARPVTPSYKEQRYINFNEWNIDGTNLVIDNVPDVIRNRFAWPQLVTYFIRDFYDDLADQLIEKMNSSGNEYLTCLVTGIPDTGITVFSLYYLYRLVNDQRYSDWYIILEYYKGEGYLLTPIGNKEYALTSIKDNGLMSYKNTILFSDIAAYKEPEFRCLYSFVFSSLNPSRYKEFMKAQNSITFYLPTWNEDELMRINDNNVSNWREAFELCGGVPRLVFKEDYKKIIEFSIENEVDAFTDFMKYGSGEIDECYSLRHINPPRNIDGKYNFTGDMILSFASDKVYKGLISKLDQFLAIKATNNYNYAAWSKVDQFTVALAIYNFNSGAWRDVYYSGAAGKLFEKMCLWSSPFTGKTLTMTRLDVTPFESVESTEMNITFPNIFEELPKNWTSGNALLPEALYQPRKAYYESGDVCCLLSTDNNCYHLVMLQMTVSDTHNVNSKDLLRIVDAYSSYCSITELSLVFVTPLKGELVKMQTITTQNGSDTKHWSEGLKGLRQYKLEYKL